MDAGDLITQPQPFMLAVIPPERQLQLLRQCLHIALVQKVKASKPEAKKLLFPLTYH